jgi:hypothetical protein
MQLMAVAVRTLSAGLLLSLLSGCARKAPGPMECHAFARRVLGLPPSAGLIADAERRVDRRVQMAVEELTVSCLTTPFDRELVACTESGAGLRGCFAAFQARHPERAARALPNR